MAQFYALIDTAYANLGAPPVYVWSAAHNPLKNDEPIDPPATGCLPDVAGDKGCPLYSSATQYPVTKGIRSACGYARPTAMASARARTGLLRVLKVGYSCDATLVYDPRDWADGTTAGQPARQKPTCCNTPAAAWRNSAVCRVILALEQIDQCSCCASQVCGCAAAGIDIDAETRQADRRAKRRNRNNWR